MKPLYYLLLFISSFVWGQDFIIGKVLDEQGIELPYVNIGLVGKNIGTVSDEKGIFDLEMDTQNHLQDTLRFSMIGFGSKAFTVAEFLKRKEIEVVLEPSATALEEVVLTTERTDFKTKVLGNNTTSKLIVAAFTTNRLGNEMGFVVRGRKRPMILKKFNISIAENDYGPIQFRVNFYNVENELPKENILKEPIYLNTDVTSGLVSLDLTPYEIVMDEDFFISIEWIEDLGPGTLYFSGGFFGSPLIAREVSQGKWTKIGSASVGMNVEVRY